MPPEMSTVQKVLFYKDPQKQFTQILLRGMEFKLLTFNILFFAVLDLFTPYLAANATYLNLFIIYVTNKLIAAARHYFGRRNMAKKTLIDERFIM